ncbi:hypothetical protein [Azomonas macrocytogenes]|uniref:Uncharacterized protein n=1 Tax=Azomonas macrocytogenes TaxID=69962 RepID=A0A839T631_AZOMA|nr:hypothetical protein [Azomonas macrocytogenes]MBB3103754.1 hypothetical protein [Azomonas macrocytogenes]
METLINFAFWLYVGLAAIAISAGFYFDAYERGHADGYDEGFDAAKNVNRSITERDASLLMSQEDVQ